ncbi:hypothetical protein HNR65_002044 [Desulfosalsimonas propionicica]|uniref:Uncharacterized protein n=1 Tax=Desulfosalsimonas propionicica TaxID=332175 RepID=A0A7W0C9M2_9BACT|nr:hypothetical protein [Desulfosalsimonas propionicica]
MIYDKILELNKIIMKRFSVWNEKNFYVVE